MDQSKRKSDGGRPRTLISDEMVEVIFKPFLELKCPQIETSPVAKSEEKWLFSQDTFTHAGVHMHFRVSSTMYL